MLSAMLMAVGFVLPLLFVGQSQDLGRLLLPLHIPVFLCGLICGWKHGLAVGFLLPLWRSFVLAMPAIYPEAVAMAFELATYGAIAGALYFLSHKSVFSLYYSLIAAMIVGRLVFGAAMFLMLGNDFTLEIFLSTAFLTALPGVCLQFILIPAIMVVLKARKFDV